MGKYLFQGTYTEQGVKGLLKDGGSGRVRAVEQMAASVGATVECYYFAHGSDDFFLVMDLPDTITAVALALIVNATGTLKVRSTPLITPQELDRATQISASYRAPGH
jgi:uncharacterized protein with GYD domain